ncbi:MAG: hypothetical protein JNL01_08220 [Bdellovibrionales bacterium]|nr:hypothetical protein [Bdellovibrionales bacterium]
MKRKNVKPLAAIFKGLFLGVFLLVGALSLHRVGILKAKRGIASASETAPLDRYWRYRTNLLNSFVWVGDEPGESVPAPILMGGSLFYADSTCYLGQYLSVLATELALLRKSGADTKAVRMEIFYALNAFDRLSKHANQRAGIPDRIDGYFVREDIPVDFLKNRPMKDVQGIEAGSVDEARGLGVVGNEVSQDQVISLLAGYRLLGKFLDEKDDWNGRNLRRMVNRQVESMVRYVNGNGKRKAWRIVRPDTGKNVDKGPDARIFSGPILEAARQVTGEEALDDLSRDWSSLLLMPVLGATPLPYQWFTRSMIFVLGSISNTWGAHTQRAFKRLDKMYDIPMYPLQHAVIFDKKLHPKSRLTQNFFLGMLNNAPDNGPVQSDMNSWNSPDRFYSHRRTRANPPVYKEGDWYFSAGDRFSGLDYMTLHNLYLLYFQPEEVSKYSPSKDYLDRLQFQTKIVL